MTRRGRVLSYSQWPHNTGPVMNYMTKCQDSCTTADSASAEWFKISEESYQSGTTTWSQAQLRKAFTLWPKAALTLFL